MPAERLGPSLFTLALTLTAGCLRQPGPTPSEGDAIAAAGDADPGPVDGSVEPPADGGLDAERRPDGGWLADDGRDTDGDGVPDVADPCPEMPSWLPRDVDGDGFGDACDDDDDGDGVLDVFDPCPWLAAEPDAAACAADRDADGIADADDPCPTIADPGDGRCPGPLEPYPWTRPTTALLPDGDGLLVGTRGGVLGVNADGVRIARWTAGHGLGGHAIAAMDRAPDGAIWVAHDWGLGVIRPDGLVLRASEADPRPPTHDIIATADGVWFTADDGLWRIEAARATRVGEPARALLRDDAGDVWRVDGASAERLGRPLRVADGLAGIGALHGGAPGAEPGTIWLFGEWGAAAVRAADGAVTRAIVTGDPVRDLVERHGELLLATASGLRRVDRDGRLLPRPYALGPVQPPLPTDDVQALALDAAGDLWAGTAAGLFRVDGVISVYSGRDLPCVRDAERFDGRIWLSTDDGLRTIEVDGHIEPVDGLLGREITAMTRTGDALWVATEAGITVFGPDRGVVERLPVGVDLPDAPITAVVYQPEADAVWVASDGDGIARSDAGGWFYLRGIGAGPRGPSSDFVQLLADGGDRLWISDGFHIDAWAYDAAAFDQTNRLLAVRHIAAGAGRLYAANQEDVTVFEPGALPAVLRRQVGQVPSEAGTDVARAVAFDGQNLWLAMDRSRRQPEGSILRRSPDPAIRDGVLFSPEELALPAAHLGLSMRWLGDELAISTCGERILPGGLTLLGGRGLIGVDAAARRLPGGDGARLTTGPGGWPLVVGAADGRAFAAAVDRGAVEDIALPADIPPPIACDVADAEGDLWCVFDDSSVGLRRGNDQWQVRPAATLPTPPEARVRGVAAESDVVAWLATDRGVVRIEAGRETRFDQASTDGGLPDDDVRAVDLAGGRLYAATAAGVAVYDIAADRWQVVGGRALRAASARATTLDRFGRLWIATDTGLRIVTGGPLADDAPRYDGLRGVTVADVAISADGRVFAATARGLVVLDPGGGRRDLTLVNGLPGHGATGLMIDPEGDVWVGGVDGIARLELDRL